MSNIEIENIGRDISSIPVEILMRDQIRETIRSTRFNIIVNLHSNDGTHWVLDIRKNGGEAYYFDSFGVETPLVFLEEYVDLGSDERIQEND